MAAKKVTAELLPEELEQIIDRAKALNLSPNDYLRRALANERFFEDEVRNGNEVLVRHRNGATEKVHIPQPA